MRARSLTFALPLLLALNASAVAQAPAVGGVSPCGPFVEFEMADMTGPILLDPSLVSSVQPSPEKPKIWSLVRWRDGQTTVEGSVEQVTKKLGRQ